MARRVEPFIPDSLTEALVSKYVEIRENEATPEVQDQFYYTSARTLLGAMRLALALVFYVVASSNHVRHEYI